MLRGGALRPRTLFAPLHCREYLPNSNLISRLVELVFLFDINKFALMIFCSQGKYSNISE